MKYKLPLSNTLLLTFIVLENAALFYFFKAGILGQGMNAWCLFMSSFLFGIILLYKFHKASFIDKPSNSKIANRISYIILPVLFLSGLIWLWFLYDYLYSGFPIDPTMSDIVPVIQILCRRLLAGENPYGMISLCGYTQQVTYLSMHWLPFTIAEMLKIDYRWIASGVWCIAAILLFIRGLKTPNIYMRYFLPILILASNFVLFYGNMGIPGITIELMIAGYYMLLISGLNQQNAFVQGLFISFCMLSRYSLVLWLPLYAFVLFVSNHRKQLYLTILVVFVVVLISYVIPFLSKDWSILSRGYKTYDSGAMFEWTRLMHSGPYNGKPLMLFSGTGFAYHFYDYNARLEMHARIKAYQVLNITWSLSVTAILGIWYWFNREKINFKIFLLGSFKIYLAVFLFLIQVPYEYLMIVGNFVSIAIFCEQARYRIRYQQ